MCQQKCLTLIGYLSSQVFRFSAAINSALGSLNICLQWLNQNKRKPRCCGCFDAQKKRNLNKCVSYHIFYSTNTQRTPCEKKTFWLLLLFLRQMNFQTLLLQTWLILVLLQLLQTYYSRQPPTLCQTVAPLQPTHSLMLQHFPALCQVSVQSFRPGASTFNPLKPQPFVAGCITTRTSLGAVLFKATWQF